MLGGLYAIFHDSDGSGGSGGSAAKSGAGGGRVTAVAVRGDLGDVGTIDAGQVAGFLRGRVARGAAETAPNADRAASSADGSFAAASPRAVDGCVNQYASEGSIRFRGSGSYQGRPAVVLGIDAGPRTIVFVVAADDCARVLYSASR